MTLEQQQILESFKQSGNKAKVARDLGIDVNRVKRTLRQLSQLDAPTRPDWQQSFIEWAKANNHPIPAEFQEQVASQPAQQPEHPRKVNIVHAPANVRRVAFISDVHIPFEDKLAVQAMLKFLSDFRPDLIILGGDIYDFYLVSDHDKDPGRIQTLQDEFDSGQYLLKALGSLAPSVVFMEGNHEQRLQRVMNRNPGLYKLRALDFRHAAELPEAWQCYPSQTHYRIGGLLVLHGDLRGRGTAIKHAASGMLSKLRTSCIFGHLHRFGTHYETDYSGTVRAGFANGHLSDVAEAKYITAPDWQSGFSTICFGASQDIFAVQQHLVIDGRFIVDGREYML